jgi:hypothetical protein
MLVSLCWYVKEKALIKAQKQFMMIGVIYFGVLLLAHIACLIKIELYGKFIIEVGKWSIGTIVFLLCILGINIIRAKSW